MNEMEKHIMQTHSQQRNSIKEEPESTNFDI